MDWRYALFILEQATPSLVILALPILAFCYFSAPERRLVACSPNLFALATFGICCALAANERISELDAVAYIPIACLVATVVLLVPSVLALRPKAAGVIHVATLVGAALTFFVCSMGIARDWL